MLNRALELFEELYDCGIRFKVVDGMLEATAPRCVLIDELKQEIAANKELLLGVIADAPGVLDRYGVHRFGSVVALWRAADLPEVRIALKATGLGDAEVRYLDDPGADIPTEFRKSWPPLIQQIWEKNGVLGTPEERIAAGRKARLINFIFDEYGTSRKAKILMRHGRSISVSHRAAVYRGSHVGDGALAEQRRGKAEDCPCLGGFSLGDNALEIE